LLTTSRRLFSSCHIAAASGVAPLLLQSLHPFLGDDMTDLDLSLIRGWMPARDWSAIVELYLDEEPGGRSIEALSFIDTANARSALDAALPRSWS